MVGNSITANATVTGTTPIDLLPPFLVAPAVDPVDVLAYPNGITMRIEYLAALDGDRARLVEVNPPAGSPQFPLVAFNSNKRVNTVLTLAYLVARQGKTLELRWNLNRNGGQAGKSTPTPVRVLKIADGDPRLPTPNIAGNTNTVLDVEALNDGARILAVKWPVFEPAQPIWVTCKGFDNNGNPISTDVRSGEPNDSLDGLNFQAPVAWLRGLKDGTELKVEFSVSLDGSLDKASAIKFPMRIYTAKTLPALQIESSPMILDGIKLLQSLGWSVKEVENNTMTRQASGGSGAYNFSSDLPAVADVDQKTGKVYGLSNGETVIRVSDERGNTASYPVTVSNVYRVATNNNNLLASEAEAWRQSVGGEILVHAKWINSNFSNWYQVIPTAPGDNRRWYARSGNYINFLQANSPTSGGNLGVVFDSAMHNKERHTAITVIPT